MNTKIILAFLKNIAANNNREWFQEHKSEYETVKKEFEAGVEDVITTLTTIDSEIAHLKVKDCTYRFYRDTRFSSDKSPYKRHLGAFICAKGRKALRGGCGGLVLVANQYTNLVPQRNNGKYRPMA